MMQTLKNLIKEFNGLKSDADRFKFLLGHKGIFKLMLDNDDTFVKVSDKTLESLAIDKYSVLADDLSDSITGIFHEYLGLSDGIFILLDVIGIKAESV